MAEPFVAEIRIFAGSFAPEGWAYCHGDLIEIAQNPALYSLLSIVYGGDGRQTFALPNIKDRVIVGAGQGPNLTNRPLGFTGGFNSVNLDNTSLAAHGHSVNADITYDISAGTVQATDHIPVAGSTIGISNVPFAGKDATWYTESAVNTVPLGGVDVTGEIAIASNGGGQAHDNRQPVLALHYIIALYGEYPIRP